MHGGPPSSAIRGLLRPRSARVTWHSRSSFPWRGHSRANGRQSGRYAQAVEQARTLGPRLSRMTFASIVPSEASTTAMPPPFPVSSPGSATLLAPARVDDERRVTTGTRGRKGSRPFWQNYHRFWRRVGVLVCPGPTVLMESDPTIPCPPKVSPTREAEVSPH